MNKWNRRSVRVFSRHPSHNSLRRSIYLPFLACIRFGSQTEWERSPYQINSPESVRNSSNKKRMKMAFKKLGVITAKWYPSFNLINEDSKFPILAKKKYGSKGKGMVKFDNFEELCEWLHDDNTNTQEYIFEQFYNYSREYRLHIDTNGCFHATRKMLKSDATDRWFRNSTNCVWFLEENEKFDKPVNWDIIVDECVKALDAVGLDIGACDVKVQSATDSDGNLRENPEFIVIEINSAPSMKDGTEEKYRERIPLTFKNKYNL